MHELGITRSIVAIVSEHADGAKVTRVRLEIGKLSAVLPDAVRFCFEAVSRGTPAEGATLEIVEIAGRARCRMCAAEVALERPFGRCACGCSDLERISGDELKVRDMEVV